MQRPLALAATAGLLCLVFLAQTLALPLPVGNITLASQIFPPTIIYLNEPFPAAATPEEPSTSTYVPSGPTGIICRADPRYHGALQASMYAIAIILTILTTVLSGLTTGVMGIDDLRLQIWVHTGDQKQKEYAGKLLKVRSHPNWLLASLIITSVAISEALPLVLSHIFRPGYWLPFVLSTLIVAFMGQFVPYAIMPMYILRTAGKMTWFLEGLKWLSAPASVPTAWLIKSGKEWRFNHGHKKLESILQMDELEAFIKLHEVDEGFGGKVKGEVGAVARGIIRNQNETIGLHVDQPWDSVRTLQLSDKISDELVKQAMDWHLDSILITERTAGHGEVETPPKIIGNLAIMDLYDALCIPISTQSVRDLPIHPVLVIRAGSSKFSSLAAFAQTNAKFAVVVPTKVDSISTPGSIKWSSGMNVSSTSLSDSEDHMSIPIVPDAASIQTPLGILTYEVLLKTLFSSPKNELDHRWCRNSRDSERQGGHSRRQSRANEAHGSHSEGHDSLSALDAISSSEVNPPGKGHNLRALKQFGIAALSTGKLLPSLRRKRSADANGQQNGDSFDAAPRMENARPSLERPPAGPGTLNVSKRNESNKDRGLRRRTPNQGPNSKPAPLRSPPRTLARGGRNSGLHTRPASPRSSSTGELAVTAWRSISSALNQSTRGSATEIYRKESRSTKRVTVHKFFDGASGTVRAERFTDYSECEETRIVLRGGPSR